MKKYFLIAIIICIRSSANCQEFLFNVDQSATAVKNSKTGKFIDAEVKDAKATIILQKQTVLVDGETHATYKLYPKGIETRVNPSVTTYKYNGKDKKNAPVSFVYTVNSISKEAVVEVSNRKVKSYYFGTYSASDLANHP